MEIPFGSHGRALNSPEMTRASRVYLTDVRARNSDQSLLNRLDALFSSLKLTKAVAGKKVAIKTHVGAPLCTRYLRPVFVRRIVDRVREHGGEPFVTDTTALDIRRTRGTASGYLEVASTHGFTMETLNAPLIVADGFSGNDYVTTKIDGYQLKKVQVAKALTEADLLISVAHFKGHSLTGIGGTCKNIGMGGCSKLGKNSAHFKGLPEVDEEKCNGCRTCLESCPVHAISLTDGKANIDASRCFACRACIEDCPERAIGNKRVEKEDFNLRMADLVYGLLKLVGKENLFCFNFILEVDWLCDCEHNQRGWSDLPIVPDIGITASKDPVAIDQASVDLVKNAPGTPGSKAEEAGALEPGVDKFFAINGISPSVHLEALERLGVGSRKYSLIEL